MIFFGAFAYNNSSFIIDTSPIFCPPEGRGERARWGGEGGR